MKKKILALVLAVLMILAVLPASIFAASPTKSIDLGIGTWKFESTGNGNGIISKGSTKHAVDSGTALYSTSTGAVCFNLSNKEAITIKSIDLKGTLSTSGCGYGRLNVINDEGTAIKARSVYVAYAYLYAEGSLYGIQTVGTCSYVTAVCKGTIDAYGYDGGIYAADYIYASDARILGNAEIGIGINTLTYMKALCGGFIGAGTSNLVNGVPAAKAQTTYCGAKYYMCNGKFEETYYDTVIPLGKTPLIINDLYPALRETMTSLTKYTWSGNGVAVSGNGLIATKTVDGPVELTASRTYKSVDGNVRLADCYATHKIIFKNAKPTLNISYFINYNKIDENGQVINIVSKKVDDIAPGTEVAFTPAALNLHKPMNSFGLSNYEDGAIDGGNLVTITTNEQIVNINYVLLKGNFEYNVDYYDSTGKLGEVKYFAARNTSIELTLEQLNKYQPAKHKTGVQDKIALLTENGQRFKVYYDEIPEYTYQVIYRFIGLEGNVVMDHADLPIEEAVIEGTIITLDEARLSKYALAMPAYTKGQQVGDPVITEYNREIIVECYAIPPMVGYTVIYRTTEGNIIGTVDTGTELYGTSTDGLYDVDRYTREDGYEFVGVTGPATIADQEVFNIIIVTYKELAKIRYDIVYFLDSIDTVAVGFGYGYEYEGNEIILTENQLNEYHDYYFKQGKQIGTAIAGQGTVVKVLYEPTEDVTVTLEYLFETEAGSGIYEAKADYPADEIVVQEGPYYVNNWKLYNPPSGYVFTHTNMIDDLVEIEDGMVVTYYYTPYGGYSIPLSDVVE